MITMMILGIILAIMIFISALYGFGFFDTPYMGTFRVAFYFSLIFFVVALLVSAISQRNQGYDPTPSSRENVRG